MEARFTRVDYETTGPGKSVSFPLPLVVKEDRGKLHNT